MQVETNNYNILGRVGPHYPQPEYRPKNNSESGKATPEGAEQKSHSEKASTKLLFSHSTEGRLNLQAAKALTAETALAISQLPPNGRNQGPHNIGKNVGLLPPRYV
jgi:hypothetical protein